MLNNKGPKTDPWGTPIRRRSYSLKDELIFVLYFLLLRKLEMSLRDLESNSYENSLANNRSCCRKSNALDKSTNKAPNFLPLFRFFLPILKHRNQWTLRAASLSKAHFMSRQWIVNVLIDFIIKTTFEFFGYNRYNTNGSIIRFLISAAFL